MAGALWLVDAGLVLVSMPLASVARISVQTVIVSAAVAVAFVLAGLLMLRIAGKARDVCRLQPLASLEAPLADAMRGLLTGLILAGAALDVILVLVTVGLLGRIGEGFAIFG